MPNIAQNPHEAPPPDYRLAAQRLLAIWQAQNALDRQEWDAQLEADVQAAQRAREQQQHEEGEQQRLLTEEQETALQEEKKKNRNKFLPFADMQISTSMPILPSPLVEYKLLLWFIYLLHKH
ncbi:hypothetical protein SCLCIDRAFT_28558 [Scleroderma citrinum Foug A]|uniref:Uncharacterized protein n=1 Tax=Scleroderma citrinum Foug A TaxID=1036808 RepID=A0A0C2Z745_9AGAM|nr:hypothetical protein SCLCIDRAFT_28558 [Scleroderma citrinum Foug A]